MLFRDMNAVFSGNYAKHIKQLCVQKVEYKYMSV